MRNAQSETKNNLIWESDGFAAVLPSDKREIVLTLRNHFGLVTGMTGDGVNDAPALSAAQVGIAVDGATDAAKNAADLILTEPGLSPIYGAVLESRRIFARIKVDFSSFPWFCVVDNTSKSHYSLFPFCIFQHMSFTG